MTATKRRWVTVAVVVAVFLLVLLTKGIWSADPSSLNGSAPQQVQLQTASAYDVPANGYIANGKCYVVLTNAGGMSAQVPCSQFKKLPPKVRQCAGSVASVGIIGGIFHLAHMLPALLSGMAGACIPW